MHSIRTTLTLVVGMAAALSLATRPSAAQLVSTDLNPAGAMYSYAYDINSSGQVLGVWITVEYDADGNMVGFQMPTVIWNTDGTLTSLDPDGNFGYLDPRDINDSGQAIGTWQRTETGESGAFIWDEATGMVDMGALSHGGVKDTEVSPWSINANGWVIGDSRDSSGFGHSWIYRDGVMEEITDAEGRRFSAVGLNDQGQVGGWVIGVTESYYPAAIWEKPVGASVPTVTRLVPEPLPPASELSWVVAISNIGEVVIQNFYTEDVRVWRPDGTRKPDGTLNGTLTSLHIGGYTTYDEGGYPTDPHYWDTVANWPAYVRAEGIDSSGRVYGSVELTPAVPEDPYTYKLWVWDDGTVTDVVAPGDPSTSMTPLQMNSTGQMLGSYLDQQTFVSGSFLWQAGDATVQSVPSLPGVTNRDVDVAAINDAGQMAGTVYTNSGPHACLWTTPPSNQPPVLTVPSPLQTFVGSPVTFSATAADPDEGDTLTFSLTSAPIGASMDPATGVFTWTPTAIGAFTFDVTVTDKGGLADTKTVTVNVAPAIGVGKATATTKSKTVTVQVPLTNRSATAATNVILSQATLGGVPSSVPHKAFTLLPGATVTCSLSYKTVPTGNAKLVIEGASSLGGFSSTQMVKVP